MQYLILNSKTLFLKLKSRIYFYIDLDLKSKQLKNVSSI